MKRQGNTGREMIESGAWIRLERKYYRHVSGIEIAYDCNHWAWKVSDGTAYRLLWVARHWAEKLAAELPACECCGEPAGAGNAICPACEVSR